MIAGLERPLRSGEAGWEGWVHAFSVPEVRDLAWSLLAPAIASDARIPELAERPITSEEWDFLRRLESRPKPLVEFLAERTSPMLGRYFEALHSFWLGHAPGFELLAEGVVLHGRHRETLGELDFVYRRGGQVIHREVAVKFYLRFGEHCVGPGLRDTLAGKLNRMASHQLLMGRSSEASAAIGGAPIDRQEVCLPGVLFDSDPRAASRWARVSDVEDLSGFHRVDKLDWFCGRRSAADRVSPAASIERPEHWIRLLGDGRLERIFRVPDDWPERAETALAAGHP